MSTSSTRSTWDGYKKDCLISYTDNNKKPNRNRFAGFRFGEEGQTSHHRLRSSGPCPASPHRYEHQGGILPPEGAQRIYAPETANCEHAFWARKRLSLFPPARKWQNFFGVFLQFQISGDTDRSIIIVCSQISSLFLTVSAMIFHCNTVRLPISIALLSRHGDLKAILYNKLFWIFMI